MMKSDFEKLIVAQKYIAILEKEKEKLKAEVEELFLEKRKAEIELNIEKNRKEKLTKGERKTIKTDDFVQRQEAALNNCRTKLKGWEHERNSLVMKIVNLKEQINDA